MPETREQKPLTIALVNLPFCYFPGVKGKSLNYARPPLGIAYLASFIRKNLDHPADIHLIDCLASDMCTEDAVFRKLIGLDPDVIGFSVVTGTRDIAGRLAMQIKQARPRTRVVLGGPHITALPLEPAPGVDAVFVGEGEASFLKYLEWDVLQGMKSPIEGCLRPSARDSEEELACHSLLDPLDLIPIPARDLLPADKYYHSYPHQNTKFATMFTSRGCPHHCAFCGNERLWMGKVRYHSPGRVFEEIDRLAVDQGVDLLFFEDDTFLANRPLAFEVMAHMRTRHPHLKWLCHTRADTLDEESVSEMAASGCVEVQIGVESGSAQILEKTGKDLDLESIEHAYRLLNKTKIKSWATFILGNEGETRQTIRETVDFSLAISPSYASFIVLLPFPGTRSHDVFQSRGWIKATRWSDYSWHGWPVFETPALSAQDLVELRKWAFRRFYLRPSKLLSILADVLRAGSLREIRRSFRSWLTVSFQRNSGSEPKLNSR